MVKNTESVNKNKGILFNIHKILNLDNSLRKKKENQKILLFPYSTLEGISNDTTHNLYDDYIGRRKIDWTKNAIYSSSPH